MANCDNLLGTVTDVTGETLRILGTPNGSVLVYGDRGTALGFDPAPLAVLRELLDRAAMPGRAPKPDASDA